MNILDRTIFHIFIYLFLMSDLVRTQKEQNEQHSDHLATLRACSAYVRAHCPDKTQKQNQIENGSPSGEQK